MALDLIKEYLIGIGFQVNEDSFNDTKKSMKDTENVIKNFNDNSKKGFSETNDSLGNFFKLLSSSYGTLGKLSPELRTPFAGLITDIILIKKLYSEFTSELKKTQKPNIDITQETKEKVNTKNTKNTNYKKDEFSTAPKPSSDIIQKFKTKSEVYGNEGLSVVPKKSELPSKQNLIEGILNTQDASKSLAAEGGNAIKLFSTGAIAEFALVAVGVVATVAAISKLISSISDLGKQDIDNEKLSRQLWTTKETAKEVDMAMKTLGVSMQDLWLSPTLLKQFNQLRQDSASLKLPQEYAENLKTVQGISLEFARLKQLGALAFQWIGNYILKYAAGPLKEFKQGLNSFNGWLIENIPQIGKIVGTALGAVLNILTTLGKAISGIVLIFSKGIGFITDLLGMLPEPLKNITKLIAAIGLVMMTGPVGAVIALIAALDDLFTYLKGGKSLIGSFFEGLFGDDKNQKSTIANVGSKVQEYSKNNASSIPQSYTTNTSNLSSKTNSDNSTNNDNKFYIYGSSDSNSIANAVQSKFSGVATRNLQGVVK